MIRGIDNQMMIQQSLNASKIVGERHADKEVRKEFQAHLERERVVNEQNTVGDAEKVEHRRIEKEKDEQHTSDEYTDPESRMLKKNKRGAKTPQEENAEKLLAGGVGVEIDIDV